MDHGLQDGAFGNLPTTSGAALKGRQMATMPKEGSPLTAGISKVHQHFGLGIVVSSSLE